MPRRLRPTAPIAAAAVLVGDPGRALMLAQELLEKPKMSNHARGLWGYSGEARGGGSLTIQSTGMGGPSAAIVLTDLAELGVRRAVRVGTCATGARTVEPGALLLVDSARAEGGSAAPYGAVPGETLAPDPDLAAGLRLELAGAARATVVASFDAIEAEAPSGNAADLQTATLFACARTLGVAVAALLIVETAAGGGRAADLDVEEAARRAGRAAAAVLSP